MTDPAFARHARRLSARPSADAWIGLVVRAIPAEAREREGTIERTPDHFLGALWLPPSKGPSRWPEAVVIGSPAAQNAIAQLLDHLPADARLYLASRDEVDAALAATILRDGDRNLEPCQRAGLDAFIAAERARDRARIEERYSDRDPRYEQFRAVVTTPAPPPAADASPSGEPPR